MERAKRCFGITAKGKIHNLDIHRCKRTGDWRFYCHEHWRQPIYFLAIGILLIVGKVADFSTVMNLFKTSTTVQAPSPTPELPQPPLAQTPITGGAQPAQTSSPLKSLEAYCNKMKDLEDRFFEKDEFINYMTGKEVEWTGFVTSVSSTQTSDVMSLWIVSNIKFQTCTRGFFFSDKQLNTKLYVLRPNDKVQVTGVYKNPWTFYLEGKAFKRLDD